MRADCADRTTVTRAANNKNNNMFSFRVRLTWTEKQQIRMKCLRRKMQGRKVKILQVCVWAKEALELDKSPPYLTA